MPSTNQGFISKLTGSGSAVDWSCYVEGKDNAEESRVALFPANCGAVGQPDCQAYVCRFNPEHHCAGLPDHR